MDKISNSLSVIINELNSRQIVDNNDVAQIVDYAKPTVDDLTKYNLFNHCDTESYGRKLIHDTGNFKLLLMSWKPGDFTAIHNHGSVEWGCVYFFGNAEHRLYDVANNELTLTESNSFKNGDIASVCGDLTHLMGNSSNKEFFTLHIYGSNILSENISSGAKVYVPENRSLVTTNGSAYINMQEGLKLSEHSFNRISQEALLDYFNLVKPFYYRNNQHDTIDRIELFERRPDLFYLQ